MAVTEAALQDLDPLPKVEEVYRGQGRGPERQYEAPAGWALVSAAGSVRAGIIMTAERAKY